MPAFKRMSGSGSIILVSQLYIYIKQNIQLLLFLIKQEEKIDKNIQYFQKYYATRKIYNTF